MRNFDKRLRSLERFTRKPGAGLPYVWMAPGQTPAEAFAAAGLPPDAPNEIYTWQPTQAPTGDGA